MIFAVRPDVFYKIFYDCFECGSFPLEIGHYRCCIGHLPNSCLNRESFFLFVDVGLYEGVKVVVALTLIYFTCLLLFSRRTTSS